MEKKGTGLRAEPGEGLPHEDVKHTRTTAIESSENLPRVKSDENLGSRKNGEDAVPREQHHTFPPALVISLLMCLLTALLLGYSRDALSTPVDYLPNIQSLRNLVIFSKDPPLHFCPPPGPLLPPPALQNGPSESLIATTQFENLPFNSDSSYAIKASIGTTEIFKYAHIAPPYAASRHTVLFETKFRIASVTKLFTALAVILSGDKIGWEDSIQDYVPELRDKVWRDVTISALAGHSSGLGRFACVGDLAAIGFNPKLLGITPVNNTLSGCDPYPGGRVCTHEEVLNMFNHPAERPRSPNSGPLYSNIGFNLLGKALEKVHSNSYEEVIQDLILDPLNLADSTFITPTDRTKAFLPNPRDRWFVSNFANYNPTGGLWSTPNDLLTFMRSIMNHDLLSPAKTRKWLQPRSLLPSLHQLVGAPWEIFRPDDIPLAFPRPINIYTKSGGVNGYAGYGILVPEYDLAIAITAAGNSSGLAVQDLMPIVIKGLIPFADAQAREQAKSKYTGIYTLPDSKDQITITQDSGPGLLISTFIMNGVSVLTALAGLLRANPATFSARLYPMDPDSWGTEKEFWRINLESTVAVKGFAESKCVAWGGLDRLRYVREQVDAVNFVMVDGRAVGIEVLGWRTTLKRGM